MPDLSPYGETSTVVSAGNQRSAQQGLIKPAVKRVAVSTLGCKVNTFESELIAQRLGEGAYERVDAREVADLYIVNSCTVTAEADRQTRQLARKLKKQNPSAQVLITGCYAETHADQVAQIDGVDLVVGNAAKLDIPVIVNQALPPREAQSAQIIKPALDDMLALPGDLLKGYEAQTRGFIQIQQGCDRGCTFCIIHTARGASRSFSAAAILAQFAELVGQGYKELVLCGVDLGAYGEDLADEISLAGLVQSMLALKLDCRIRISSIDPAHVSDELIRLMANEPALCEHVHLSMQSANALVLKQMKRRASRDIVFERVGKLRQAVPKVVISADVLVGFPTESNSQFEETLGAIEDLQIAYPHVFPYSERAGTPAAKIKKQVPKAERKSRAKAVREAGQLVWQRVAEQQVGACKRVIIERKHLVDSPTESYCVGRSDDYFPVKLRGKNLKVGDWSKARILGIDGEMLVGEICA